MTDWAETGVTKEKGEGQIAPTAMATVMLKKRTLVLSLWADFFIVFIFIVPPWRETADRLERSGGGISNLVFVVTGSLCSGNRNTVANVGGVGV